MLFKNTNTHRGNFGLQQTPSLTTHLKANNGVANNFHKQKHTLDNELKSSNVSGPPQKPMPIINNSAGMHTHNKVGVHSRVANKNSGFAKKNLSMQLKL